VGWPSIRTGRFRPAQAAAALIAAVALAGCGASNNSDRSDGATSGGAGATAPAAPPPAGPSKPRSSKNLSRTVARLCSRPCTDGQQDFVDRLAIVPRPPHSSLLDDDDVIVSMRVRLKNIGYIPAVIKAGGAKRSEFKLIDSHLRTLSPSETFDKRKEPVAQCPRLRTVTLLPGDAHTFRVCFVLADRQHLPKVLRLRNLAEIGLR
jgi:hypothetical protein